MLGHWGLAWAVVVVLVGGWFLLRRPRRAAVRYAGWLLATFAGVALLPPVIGLAPRLSWREALLRLQGDPVRSRPADQPVPFRSWFENMSGEPTSRPITGADPRAGLSERPAPSERVSASPSGKTSLDARPVGDRWLVPALATWMAGAALFLVRLARAAARVRALVADSTPAAADGLAEEAEVIRRALGVRRRVRVLVQPDIATPLCVGLIRPVIFWPITATHAHETRTRMPGRGSVAFLTLSSGG